MVGGGGIPRDYFVSTQLQLWLFRCWGCGCCWAVTIRILRSKYLIYIKIAWSERIPLTFQYIFIFILVIPPNSSAFSFSNWSVANGRFCSVTVLVPFPPNAFVPSHQRSPRVSLNRIETSRKCFTDSSILKTGCWRD